MQKSEPRFFYEVLCKKRDSNEKMAMDLYWWVDVCIHVMKNLVQRLCELFYDAMKYKKLSDKKKQIKFFQKFLWFFLFYGCTWPNLINCNKAGVVWGITKYLSLFLKSCLNSSKQAASVHSEVSNACSLSNYTHRLPFAAYLSFSITHHQHSKKENVLIRIHHNVTNILHLQIYIDSLLMDVPFQLMSKVWNTNIVFTSALLILTNPSIKDI